MSDLPTGSVVFGTLVAGAIAKMIFGAVTCMNRQRNMVKVGTVKQLNCYPVKSCRGIPVEEGVCTRLGLKIGKATDRHWMVVRSNGDFVTQRQFSKMALIQTEVRKGELAIDAPGMPTLILPLCPVTDRSKVIKCRVWEERFEGMDCDDDAAYWFSTFLKIQGLRVLFSASDIAHQDLTRTLKPWGNPSLPGDQAAFNDWCPYLMTTEESLEALNKELEEKVTMTRFRPNIVISGSPAFDEDNWSELQIGATASFRMLDGCGRCVLTTVDPDKGERDPKSEPLNTLKSLKLVQERFIAIGQFCTRCSTQSARYAIFPAYGTSPLFGVNAAVDTEGLVRVGDPVYAIRK